MSLRHCLASAAALCGALGLLFTAGCNRGPEQTKLGFLVKQPEEPWFQYEWKGAEKAGAQHGFTVVKLGVTDGEKVMAAIDNLAAQGAKGFVICTPDVRLGPAIMARANTLGLKVVTVDDQFVGPDGQLMKEVPYLGMSASDIGRTSGNELWNEMQRRGWTLENTAVCVVTFDELDTARQRTDGVIAALLEKGIPRDRIFTAPQKTTDVPGSLDATQILLTQHPEVKNWLIAGMNDTAVLGAVRAMEGRGIGADRSIGIGINGTDCLDELRRQPATGFFGSIFVSAPYEGFRTAEILYQWVHDGTQPPLDTRTPGKLITRENFEEVLRGEGVLQ